MLHNLSQFILSGHNDSRAPYILLTGPIRRSSSGGGIRKMTGVSLSMLSQSIGVGWGWMTFPNFFTSDFSLLDLKKSQNKFIKLEKSYVNFPFYVVHRFIMSHEAHG